MKLTIGLLLISTLSFAQIPMDSITHNFTYQDIVSVPGQSKEQLYLRAKEWFAITYRSSNDVLQFDDRATGKIIGKGVAVIYYWESTNVRYTITIECKDERFRYTITNFIVRIRNYNTDRTFETLEKMHQNKVFSKTDIEVKNLVNNLVKTMTSEQVAKSDW